MGEAEDGAPEDVPGEPAEAGAAPERHELAAREGRTEERMKKEKRCFPLATRVRKGPKQREFS